VLLERARGVVKRLLAFWHFELLQRTRASGARASACSALPQTRYSVVRTHVADEAVGKLRHERSCRRHAKQAPEDARRGACARHARRVCAAVRGVRHGGRARGAAAAAVARPRCKCGASVRAARAALSFTVAFANDDWSHARQRAHARRGGARASALGFRQSLKSRIDAGHLGGGAGHCARASPYRSAGVYATAAARRSRTRAGLREPLRRLIAQTRRASAYRSGTMPGDTELQSVSVEPRPPEKHKGERGHRGEYAGDEVRRCTRARCQTAVVRGPALTPPRARAAAPAEHRGAGGAAGDAAGRGQPTSERGALGCGGCRAPGAPWAQRALAEEDCA
jgi:hypothetical protein